MNLSVLWGNFAALFIISYGPTNFLNNSFACSNFLNDMKEQVEFNVLRN